MKKIIRWLDVNFEAVLMMLFFTLMIGLIIIQVFLRAIFKTGFSWGEEVARIFFVWMSFSSFGYLTRNNRHVRVGFIVGKCSDIWQKRILLICDIIFLIFSCAGFKAVTNLCLDALKYKDKLTAIPWNYSVLYLAGVLGFFMMILRNIQVIIWKLKNWSKSVEQFSNYNGVYYDNNRICFEPTEKPLIEQVEIEQEERLERGE